MRCRETRARSPARGLATSAETLGDAARTRGSRVVEARVEARGVKVVLGRARVPRERHLDRGVVDVETYVHRSGRTGRAGRKGVCVTLFGPRDRAGLQTIEQKTKNKFEWLPAPNPKTLLRIAAETAASDAAAIPPDVAAYFDAAARQLLAAKGDDAEAAVAASK